MLRAQVVLFFQGSKSRTIPAVCGFSVHLMYLSGALQYVSLFNVIFNLETLILRASQQLDYAFDDASNTGACRPRAALK